MTLVATLGIVHQRTYHGGMSQIHASAIVEGDVKLGEGVEIGPFCVLRGDITLGDNVRLLSSVSIQGPVTIGNNTILYPNASIGYEPQDYKFAPGSPTAGVVIGEDSILREHVTVHAATKLDVPTKVGDRVMMMVGSHLGHDGEIGNDVVIVNNCMLAGHTQVHDRVVLSGGVMMHQFGRIGRGVMASGGSILSNDVPPFCMTAGRNMVVGLNKVGMRRSGMSKDEMEAVRQAYRDVLRKNPPLSEMQEMLDERAKDSKAVQIMADFVRDAKRPLMPVGGRKSQGRD